MHLLPSQFHFAKLLEPYANHTQYTDEFIKKSNEITDNIVNAVRINNHLTANAINAAENFRTFNRKTESMTEFKAQSTFLSNILHVHNYDYNTFGKRFVDELVLPIPLLSDAIRQTHLLHELLPDL